MTAGYLFAIAISVIFMLFMDGAIGVMMLAFLLLMPLLSLALTLWVRKKITLTLKLPDTAAKQRTVSAILTLEKDTWLPLPFLRINFRADAHFSPLNPAAQELPPRPLAQGPQEPQASACRRWSACGSSACGSRASA